MRDGEAAGFLSGDVNVSVRDHTTPQLRELQARYRRKVFNVFPSLEKARQLRLEEIFDELVRRGEVNCGGWSKDG